MRASALLSMVTICKQQHGDAVINRGVEALPPSLRDSVRASRLLPSTWIPISAYAALLAALQLDDNALKTLGKLTAEHDVNTIYRTVFKFLSAETLAKQTPRMFGIYFKGGDIRVLESSRTHCKIDYRACHGFTRLVWQDYIAGAHAVLAFCGAKSMHTVVEDGGTADWMIASARWE